MLLRSLLLFAIFALVACSPAPQERILNGQTMGTTYTVKIAQAELAVSVSQLQEEVDDALIQVNQLMSTYIPNSELSRLNQLDAQTPFPLSEQTLKVLQEAIRLGYLTDGVLDVTVGPLVNLWGFGPDKRPEKRPSAEQVKAIAKYVGLDKFTLSGNIITKAHDDLYIDLSTIAKGYGVDLIAEILEGYGIRNYLVEIGGEMRVAGTKLDGADWRIAIERPVEGQRAVQRIISIGDNAIATSGDYRNYYELDGIRYSHLIDPRTGEPITHSVVSVTVVHASSMTADGLATALNVMGLEQAKALAELESLPILLVYKQDDEFKEYISPAFAQQVTIIN